MNVPVDSKVTPTAVSRHPAIIENSPPSFLTRRRYPSLVLVTMISLTLQMKPPYLPILVSSFLSG
jgi:hypothetical protein